MRRSCRLLIVAAAAAPAAWAAEGGFERYIQRFGKSYGDGADFAARKALFEQRTRLVEGLNARPGALWKAGLNEMADNLPSELRQRLGYSKVARETGSGQAPLLRAAGSPQRKVPKAVDWRLAVPPVLTPVKEQGGCGSCWAFSAAAAIESNVALRTGVLMSLSPQQLNSCVPNPQKCGGNGGCSGATPQLAFNYTAQVGLTDIWHYPYDSGTTGMDGECRDNSTRILAGITGYHQLLANSAEELEEAVAVEPVAVSVDASVWFLYESGIFDGCNKTHPDINHAVQLVGYGQENGTRYWIIRNSWGAEWGEKGFMRLKRHDEEPCAWDTTPRNGFGCEGGPPKIKACGECGILSDSAYPVGGFLMSSLGGFLPRRLRAGSESASSPPTSVI